MMSPSLGSRYFDGAVHAIREEAAFCDACSATGGVVCLNGIGIFLGLAVVIYAGTTIAGALSFLPGGLGVTEGAMTLALVEGAAHFDRASAVAATLLTRLATLWFAVVLGIGFLALARRRIAQRRL